MAMLSGLRELFALDRRSLALFRVLAAMALLHALGQVRVVGLIKIPPLHPPHARGVGRELQAVMPHAGAAGADSHAFPVGRRSLSAGPAAQLPRVRAAVEPVLCRR